MRLPEAAVAAAVVAALLAVLAWRTGADLVTVPAAGALLTFLAVLLRGGTNRRASYSRSPARRRRR